MENRWRQSPILKIILGFEHFIRRRGRQYPLTPPQQGVGIRCPHLGAAAFAQRPKAEFQHAQQRVSQAFERFVGKAGAVLAGFE